MILIGTTIDHWSGNAKVKITYCPFHDIQSKLEWSSLHLISQTHNRMLLEEMMLLPSGVSFVCAVLNDHYFLKQNLFQSKARKILEAHPTNPIIINRKVCFTFCLTVLSNPTKDVFKSGTLLHQDEVTNSCTK